MSPIRGPLKAQRVDGMEPDNVWFYREIDGTVSVHFDTRPIRESRSPHVSFVIPKDRAKKTKKRQSAGGK